jgi:uncharacterized RDD family membrane protein YckC
VVPPSNDQPTNTELPRTASPGPGSAQDVPGSDGDTAGSPSIGGEGGELSGEQGTGQLPPVQPVPLWPPPPSQPVPGSHWQPPATDAQWPPPTNGTPPAVGHDNGFQAGTQRLSRTRVRTRARTPAPLDALGRPLASWPKRFLALLVDFVLLSVLLSWFGHAVYPNLLSSSAAVYDKVPQSQALSFLGVSFLVWLGYLSLLGSSRRGQTLGMMLYGIAVRGLDGGPVSVGRATIRSAILILASSFLVDAFWPLWDPRRQALHDKPARTVVVDVRLAALLGHVPPDRR